jgi:S-DNA-T family DNA segregation ATPase FtsK/SpoIIIE
LRLPKNESLSIALLVAGLAALLLLLPGLFSSGAPPLQVALGWGAFVVVAALVGGGVGLFLVPKLSDHVTPRLHRHLAGRGGGPASLQIPASGWKAVAFAELLLLILLVVTHLAIGHSLELAIAGQGGGLVGWAGSALLVGLVGEAAAWVIALSITAVTAWLLFREFLGLRIGSESELLPDGLRATSGSAPGVSLLGRAPNLAPHLVGLLAWCSGVLRGLLPGRGGNVAEEEHPAHLRVRKARRATEAGGSGASPTSVTSTSSEKPTTQPIGRKHGTAKERLPHSRPRPDTLPPLDLLRPDQGVLGSNPDVRLRAQMLKQTLAEFGVPVEVVSIKEGPTVTQFGLEPGEVIRELRNGEVQRRRVSVHSILRLSNDLALALSASSIRIEAPVPGRPYVGVEVPNAAKTLVSLRNVLESNEFARVASPLAAALGRNVSGDPVVLDLTALPHLLIAGATGSGKSVCINSIVCSLLMSNDSVTVRFIMVDPKMVELPAYNGVPHLIGPVITDPAQVPAALAWLILQMDDRYRIFADSGVRNIAGYNRKAAKSRHMDPLPYIILVVDELADLMMSTAFDIERQICRLAQLSRATGIHLVLATQRPSVDVITGLIKANFPARIAFAVTTQIDSRVILDASGAEKLLGRGDMLYMAPDSAKLARIQGCFVADREIDAIVEYWRTSYQELGLNRPALAPWAELLDMVTERDALLEQALSLVRAKSQISTSLLQRQLRIGFPRAARLMEQLEAMGVVGPDEGAGRSRRVLGREAETVDRTI